MKRVDSLPHGLINAPALVGPDGAALRRLRGAGCATASSSCAASDAYAPILHFDVYGLLGPACGGDPDRLAAALQRARAGRRAVPPADRAPARRRLARRPDPRRSPSCARGLAERGGARAARGRRVGQHGRGHPRLQPRRRRRRRADQDARPGRRPPRRRRRARLPRARRRRAHRRLLLRDRARRPGVGPPRARVARRPAARQARAWAWTRGCRSSATRWSARCACSRPTTNGGPHDRLHRAASRSSPAPPAGIGAATARTIAGCGGARRAARPAARRAARGARRRAGRAAGTRWPPTSPTRARCRTLWRRGGRVARPRRRARQQRRHLRARRDRRPTIGDVDRGVGPHARDLPDRARDAVPRRRSRRFRAQDGGGTIVNLASRAAWRGEDPDYWHYAAAKAGVVAMTKTIARQYGRDGVTAYAVAPGLRRHAVQRRARRRSTGSTSSRTTPGSARWPGRRTSRT